MYDAAMRNHFHRDNREDGQDTYQPEKKCKYWYFFSIPACFSKVVQARLTNQSREGGSDILLKSSSLAAGVI